MRRVQLTLTEGRSSGPESSAGDPPIQINAAEIEAVETGTVEINHHPADDASVEAAGATDTESGALTGDPDMVPDHDLVAALEAVLLVVDAPVTETALAAAVGHGPRRVRDELSALTARYTAAGSGIELREISGGWRFYTRDRFAPVVERFVLDGAQGRLSKAALETLAVIAYRQPVTRARISAVRGVNVDGVIRTLTARGLIEESGSDADTGGLLYGTTGLFLERLGLADLGDLPSLGPLLPDVDGLDDV